MRLYENLFYANLERFLATGFPALKKMLGGDHWRKLVRAFYHRHPCQTPYFREIRQEFVAYLQAGNHHELPDFLVELAHYEATERSLQAAEDPPAPPNLDPAGDLLHQPVVVSPLIRLLSYRHPVHALAAGGPAAAPSPRPTFLIACRRGDGEVKMLACNALTHRVVELLREEVSGQQALDTLAAEMPNINGTRLQIQGAAILNRLRRAEVLLGVRMRSLQPKP